LALRPTLEVPVDSIAASHLAAAHADRLEVCSDLETEGWTPDLELLQRVIELARPHETRVVALIRPRLGTINDGSHVQDFVMSGDRLESSCASIDDFAAAGVDGVAIGPLLPDGRIDSAACSSLVARAHSNGLEVSILRSIDLVPDRAEALQLVNELGVNRILTTGSNCWDISSIKTADRIGALTEDVESCRRLAEEFARVPIQVMPGGGVRSSNADQFLAVSPHLHSSCRFDGSLDIEELIRLSRRVRSAGGRADELQS
jgi:copper homeostasis protein